MASSADEVRAYVWNRSARELQAAAVASGIAGPTNVGADVTQTSSNGSAALAVPAAAATPASASPSNPMHGFGSKLTGGAKKSEQRRLRSLMAITNAEQQPIRDIFAEEPTRQIYLANGGASCGVTYDECHALLSQYGHLTRLRLVGLCPFAVAEFETADQAAACEKALDGFEWARGAADKRLLFVQYARMDASNFLDESKHPLQLVNATPLEEISPMSVCSLELLPKAISSGALDRGVVPGLLLIPNFISVEEEARLLQFVDSQPWNQVRLRQVQHYGFEFNYVVNDIERDAPLPRGKGSAGIPEPFQFLCERMRPLGALDIQQLEQQKAANAANAASAGSHSAAASSSEAASVDLCSLQAAPLAPPPFVPEQLTVNRYFPGHGIPAHVDTHSAFTDVIVSVSLGGPHVMSFVPATTAYQLYGDEAVPIHIPLPPRSLLALTGPSRYGYTHGISARRTDRISHVLTPRSTRTSLTFRQIRPVPTGSPPHTRPMCTCAFISSCDSKPALQVNGEGASGASVQLKRRPKSTFAKDAPARSDAVSPSSSISPTSSSSPSPAAASAPAPSAAPSLPPPPVPLSPEVEACHLAAVAAGRDSYTDPATGYSVFTSVALQRIRKGVCCGNACRHCPYEHQNVKAKKKQQPANQL